MREKKGGKVCFFRVLLKKKAISVSHSCCLPLAILYGEKFRVSHKRRTNNSFTKERETHSTQALLLPSPYHHPIVFTSHFPAYKILYNPIPSKKALKFVALMVLELKLDLNICRQEVGDFYREINIFSRNPCTCLPCTDF